MRMARFELWIPRVHDPCNLEIQSDLSTIKIENHGTRFWVCCSFQTIGCLSYWEVSDAAPVDLALACLVVLFAGISQLHGLDQAFGKHVAPSHPDLDFTGSHLGRSDSSAVPIRYTDGLRHQQVSSVVGDLSIMSRTSCLMFAVDVVDRQGCLAFGVAPMTGVSH